MNLLREPRHDEEERGRFASPEFRPAQPRGRYTLGVASLALAGILPLVIMSTVLVTILARDQRETTESMSRLRVQAVLGEIDRSLAPELKLLQWLASSPALRAGPVDAARLAAFEDEAQRAILVAKDWNSVALVEGGTGGILTDTWPGKPSFLPQISTGIDLGAILAAKAPSVSGYVAPGVVSPRDGILLIAPAPQDGSSLLVAALIAPPALEAMLQAAVNADPLAAEQMPAARLQLVDRNGIILADSADPGAVGRTIGLGARRTLLTSAEGRIAETDVAAAPLSGLYRSSALSGWSVLLLPAAETASVVSRPVLIAAIGGFGSVLLAALLAILVIRDLALRRRTDEALQQSQKMELIGQMTGGIAHDFNNLLTVVSGNLDLLAPELDGNPKALRMVRSASRAAERGSRLTAQLLAYARRQRLHPVTVDINRMIGEIGELLDRIRGESVPLRLALGERLWLTRIDPLQLQSAILNLVLNAREAMPRGGTLKLSTRNVEPAEAARSGLSGGAVELAVTDTGTGMSPQVAARAFDPFFTTKPVGDGSGLGLSQVFGFVQQSGGKITIDSREGVGTIVRMLLPRVTEPDDPEEQPHPLGAPL